jgi:hypothetical protein
LWIITFLKNRVLQPVMGIGVNLIFTMRVVYN